MSGLDFVRQRINQSGTSSITQVSGSPVYISQLESGLYSDLEHGVSFRAMLKEPLIPEIYLSFITIQKSIVLCICTQRALGFWNARLVLKLLLSQFAVYRPKISLQKLIMPHQILKCRQHSRLKRKSISIPHQRLVMQRVCMVYVFIIMLFNIITERHG